MQPSPLANPLVTVAQLETSGSQLDGIPPDLEDSIRFAGARLIQAAGILLKLPQEAIAQAIVVFTRFWVGPEGGSLADLGAEVRSNDISSYRAVNVTTASISRCPVSYYQAFCLPKVTAKPRQRIRLPFYPTIYLCRSSRYFT
jgi:hypothetical protein